MFLAATCRWWITAETYLFLRSFVSSPSGIWAWLAVGVLSGFLVVGTTFSIVMMWRKALPLRLAKKAVKEGEPGAAERLKAVSLETLASKPGPWMFAGLFAAPFLVPPCLALAIWSGLHGVDGRLVHGKLVFHSPAQQLQDTLRWNEDRGIFTPMPGQ